MQSIDFSQDRLERRQARVLRPSTCRLSNRGGVHPSSNSCDRRSTVVRATVGCASRRILSAREFEHEAGLAQVEGELAVIDVSSFSNSLSPLLVRRGGCGIKKTSAKPPVTPQTGCWVTIHVAF